LKEEIKEQVKEPQTAECGEKELPTCGDCENSPWKYNPDYPKPDIFACANCEAISHHKETWLNFDNYEVVLKNRAEYEVICRPCLEKFRNVLEEIRKELDMRTIKKHPKIIVRWIRENRPIWRLHDVAIFYLQNNIHK